MEITSKELANATLVPSSFTEPAPVTITADQVKDILIGFLAQKSYYLPKHLEQGFAMATPLNTTEDVLTCLQSNIRKHLVNRATKNEETYHQQALIINKIFENIDNLMSLLVTSGVKCESNELVASLIGNLLKSIA